MLYRYRTEVRWPHGRAVHVVYKKHCVLLLLSVFPEVSHHNRPFFPSYVSSLPRTWPSCISRVLVSPSLAVTHAFYGATHGSARLSPTISVHGCSAVWLLRLDSLKFKGAVRCKADYPSASGRSGRLTNLQRRFAETKTRR
jgi:hypothetical protein